MELVAVIVVPMLLIVGIGAAVLAVRALVVPSGTVRLFINGEEHRVTPGMTLLEALHSAGALIPSGCGGKGTCGYCKVRIVEGNVPAVPTDEAWIPAEELAQGYRLSCQHKIFEDIAVEVPAQYLGVRKVTATLVAARMLTPDIRELRLLPEEEIPFRAGQYIQVDIGDTGESRAYSIASEEGAREIVLNVRLVPGGLGSTWLHSIQEGHRLTISGPYGDYELPEQEGLQLVLVGGGVGVAPISSIARTVAARRRDVSVRMFLGFRTLEHAYYLDDFAELASVHPDFKIHVALDSEEREGFHHGFVHEIVDRVYERAPGPVSVFLCGPPPMIEAVQDVLRSKGVSDSEMFYDKF